MIFARCNCHTLSVAIVAQRGLLASFPTLLKRTILSRSDAAVADALCLAVVDALCFAVADALAAAGAMPDAVGQQRKKQLQKKRQDLRSVNQTLGDARHEHAPYRDKWLWPDATGP